MDDMDRELRALLTRASGSPSLARRDELVDALLARADAGGADVAAAPSVPVPFEPVAADVKVTYPARGVARAAGVSIGGWIAIGVATAAAAAGAWLLEEAVFTHDPVPSVTDPVTTVEVGVSVLEPHKVMVEPIQAGEPVLALESVTQQEKALAPVHVIAATEVEEVGHAGEVRSDSDRLSGSQSGGDGSAAQGPAVGPGQGSADGNHPGGSDRSLGTDLADGISDVEGALKGAVDDLLPEGPLADTVRPVIHAVDVGGLAHWLVGSVLCGQPASLAVTVTDDVGVVSVTVDVRTALGINVSVPLSPGSGSTWTGVLTPVVALDLGLLNTLIEVDVTARDAAGNTATTSTSVKANLLSCAG